MAEVLFHPEAEREFLSLPDREREAILHSIDKLEEDGSRLSFPHQSAVRGARHLRELGPRAGRSRWRAFYRQVGFERFVVASLGPDAHVDGPGFRRAIRRAEQRLEM